MHTEAQNPYEAPASHVQDMAAEAADPAELFAPSTLKVATMSFVTLGLYLVYWFYRNWQAIKLQNRENLMPVWRSIFSPLWAYSCFRDMRDIAQSRRNPSGASPR